MNYSTQPVPAPEREEKLMEQSRLLCFRYPPNKEEFLERHNGNNKLTPEKINNLNEHLNKIINSKKKNYIEIEEFNKMAGLFVEFLIITKPPKFYTINLRYDGEIVSFVASYRTFDHSRFSEDDEEERDMFTSFIYRPFKRLVPLKQTDGSLKLTVEMYIDFVCECLSMRVEDHQYRM